MELSPGICLTLADELNSQDWLFKQPVHDHPIQITIFLSDFVHCDIHPSFGGTQGYFSGSGMSPAYIECNQAGEHLNLVDIEIEPEVLSCVIYRTHLGSFVGELRWEINAILQQSKRQRVGTHQTVVAPEEENMPPQMEQTANP